MPASSARGPHSIRVARMVALSASHFVRPKALRSPQSTGLSRRRMMLAPRSSAERKAASHRPHHVDAGADHRGLVVGGEASADGADRVVGHGLQPGIEDLDNPSRRARRRWRESLRGRGRRDWRAGCRGPGGRAASSGHRGSVRRAAWRAASSGHQRMPASTVRVCLGIMRLSSAARRARRGRSSRRSAPGGAAHSSPSKRFCQRATHRPSPADVRACGARGIGQDRGGCG